MEPVTAFVDDLIDLDETTDLPVIHKKSKRSFGGRWLSEADDTLQILDLNNLDVTLDLAPIGPSVSVSASVPTSASVSTTASTSSTSSSNASSNGSTAKNISTLDKTAKELSCYTNDFSSINEMDMAFVGSLDQSSVISFDVSFAGSDGQSDQDNLIEVFTEAPSVLPVSTHVGTSENVPDEIFEVGDLIQLSDASIETETCNTIDEKQKPEEIDNLPSPVETLTPPKSSQLIKFDDESNESHFEDVSVKIGETENKEDPKPMEPEFIESNDLPEQDTENQQPSQVTDEVFNSYGEGSDVENEEESGDGKLLDITNFVFPSPLPKAGGKNKSLLGNNSSINLMDMSLSKLSSSGKIEMKDKFSTPKSCLKSTSNTSSDETSTNAASINQSRRKSKSVSFQSPSIYFSNVKRLSNIRKTPIRRSVNRFTVKGLKTPDSVNYRKLAKFSTPNKFSPGASPFTLMVTKFSKLALATPPTSISNESRRTNEEVSSINLFLFDRSEGDQSENSIQPTKSENSEQCIRL